MKEIIALDEAIRALALDGLAERGIDFSRDVISAESALLPTELQTEIGSLQQAINATLPEDFDYFAFVAFPDLPASFSLHCHEIPAGGSEDGTFQPERSLIEQLHEVDWEEQRAKAESFQQEVDGVIQLQERMSAPLRPTKAVQREFREDARKFIKEKRVDAARIHVMYWDEEKGLREISYDKGEALRAALPDMIARGVEIITIVVGGKPLSVERIDALNQEAQRTLREQVADAIALADEEPEDGSQPGQEEVSGPAEPPAP